jgi:hypothetical protein
MNERMTARKYLQLVSAKSFAKNIDLHAVPYFGRKDRGPRSVGGWEWACTAAHKGWKRDGEGEPHLRGRKFTTWRTREDDIR